MTADTPPKPNPSGKRGDLPASTDALAERGTDREEQMPPSKSSKLGAEKLTPEKQKRRFIEGAREAGASEDEADFDATLKRIARPAKAKSSAN